MNLFKSVFLVSGITLVALLAGCVAYKPPPSVIHADNYTALDATKHRAVPPTDKILTKQEAIAIALENNPDYVSKQLAMVSAWAIYYAQLANFSPTLSASFAATQAQSQGGSYGTGPNKGRATQYAGGLSANYQAFSGLVTTMNTLGARAGAEQSEWDVKDQRRLLIMSVNIAYNTVLQDRAFLRIQQANERFQTQMANNSLLKYNAGASSLSDLLNFKVLKNYAKSDAVQAEQTYKVDRFALAALMGLTTADLPIETRFPEISVGAADEFELGVEFYLDIAIAERPDLRSQKQALKAARYNLYAAWGAFSPTLDLSLNYGYDTGMPGGGQGSQLAPTGQDMNYNYGFAANWDLWKGGSRIATVRSQEALFDVQKQSLLSKWIEVVQSVRTQYVNLLASAARRKILDETKEMSRQRRDLVQEEYDAGNKDIATLNQAQNNLVEAQQKYVQATIDVANSRARLYAACGVEQ